MSTDLFLELGDIVEINAPSNSIINGHRYFIDYIDQRIIYLIDDTTLEKISFNIDEEGKLSDETIEAITILSRSDQKGYARQNDLSIDKWISIYLGGDLPTVITGQITNLEEDMIEVTTWPKKEKMYIDFAYQGIPLDIPFEKFVLRVPPSIATMAEEIQAQEQQQAQQAEHLEEEEEEEEVAIRQQEILAEGDEAFEIGDEFEEVTQLVNVPEEERRYDIQAQKNDILDDLLSTIPVTNRTKTALNDIHKMIERFIQLREEFSTFDESGLSLSRKQIIIKPLIKYVSALEKGIPQWILPITKNKRKLYDIGDDDDDTYEDVEKKNLKGDIEEIMNKFPSIRKKEERSKEETQPTDERNQYDYRMTQLRDFFKPFIKTDVRNDIIIEKETNTNLDVVVNNFGDFNSSNAWTWETTNSFVKAETAEMSRIKVNQFCIQRYNTGKNRLQIEKLENFQTKTTFIKITNNDNLDICGYILFPKPVINYSRIFNPKTNIKLRAQLNMIHFAYKSILSSIKNKMISKTVLDIEKNEPYSLDDVTAMTLDPDIEDDDKYEKFLKSILPNTSELLEKANTTDKVSFSKILYMLEPFLIYGDNINHDIYKKIYGIVKNEVIQNKQKIVEHKTENESYIKHNYNIKISKETLLTNYNDLREIYGIKSKYNSEIFRHILTLDNARTFMNYMSLKDLDLHSAVNIEEIAQENLEEVDKKEEIENKCENYVLTKEYFDLQQLTYDDGKPEIFFDKKYDITHYEILEEFKLERTQLDVGEFRDFLFNHLKKNVGMNDKDALEETNAILEGKRKVQEGQYAVIKDTDTSKILYYKRTGDQWILDETMTDKELGDVFCNLRNKCLKINKKCLDENISKSQFNKKLLKQMMDHFDKEFYLSKDELREKLETEFKENASSISKLTRLKSMRRLKNDRYKLELGWGLEQTEGLLKSPYEELRDNILGQSDFVKKQNDIILFTDKYCRREDTDDFWYYCVDTNIPLLPTFYKKLADAYKLGNYIQILNEIERDRGTRSDDGGYVVDKHSGYLIRDIDFDISEGYEESGYKKVSREAMAEDLGKIVAKQIIHEKQKETEDIKKIKNIIIKISEDMGISLEKDYTFIINNVTNSMETDTSIKKLSQKKMKGRDPEHFHDLLLLNYTLAYLLISIQTIIPIPRSSKSFPGCKESFIGFPFNEDETDLDSIKYLSCIVNKIRANIGVWRVLRKQNEEKIQKNLLKIIKMKVLPKDNIKLRLKTRRDYTPEIELIPTEIDVKNWITFLPPLRQLKIPKTRGLGGGFIGSFNSNIKTGNKEQFSQLSEILGKIFYFSLNIQEYIQEIIHQETPLLTSVENVPYLENVCCNEGNRNVLQYFIEKNQSIGVNNGQVHEFSKIYNSYKKLSKAKTLYDPTNTKLSYPPVDKTIFSDESIYKAFIYYCNFNKGGLPDDLMHLCISTESSITNEDTFDEKVKKLKDEGKNFTHAHLIELLNIIARNNIIKHSDEDDILHPHQYLIELLDHFTLIEDVNVSPKLINLLKTLTDSFDVLDWSKEGPEFKTVLELKNYLIMSNEEMKKRLFNFLKENSSIREKGKGSLESIKNFLETIQVWKVRGDNIYMDTNDETSYFILDFFKQAIRDISIIYPSIIENKVGHKKVEIPTHWGVSVKHQQQLQNHIEKEFKNDKLNISFPSVDRGLKNIFKKIKEYTKNLLLLMERTPFFSKINGVDTIFDSSIVPDLGEFYFLTVLVKYIDYEDDIEDIQLEDTEDHHSTDSVVLKDLGAETFSSLVEGKKADGKEIISELLVSYLNIFIERKDNLDYNNDLINEIILSAKIKETKKITKHYKDLPEEIRKVQKIHQNLKLEQWGLGQTKAVHQYDPNQFDKELGAILAQSIIEKGGEGEDEVTMRLRGVLSDEDIQEMDMEARQQAEAAIQMSLLGDDDDHGENDGDEGF